MSCTWIKVLGTFISGLELNPDPPLRCDNPLTSLYNNTPAAAAGGPPAAHGPLPPGQQGMQHL